MSNFPEFRGTLFACGAFKVLMHIIIKAQEKKDEKAIQRETSALAKLCKNQKVHHLGEIKRAAIILFEIAKQYEALETVHSALCALLQLGYYVETEISLDYQTYLPFIKHLRYL